jgi:hypothetical protein
MHPVRAPHRQHNASISVAGPGDGLNGRPARSASWSTATAVHTHMHTSKRSCELAGFEALKATTAARPGIRRAHRHSNTEAPHGLRAVSARPWLAVRAEGRLLGHGITTQSHRQRRNHGGVLLVVVGAVDRWNKIGAGTFASFQVEYL